MQNQIAKRGGARPGAGRPRRAPTISRALRDGFPAERVRAMVEKLAASEDEHIRKWAVEFLTERIEGKVTEKHEHRHSMGSSDDDDEADEGELYGRLDGDEWAAIDELDRAIEALDARRVAVLDRARERLALAANNVSDLPAGVLESGG